MPLAFESLSHGMVAFGFFNIDADMLLLEHYFFFATDFCANIERIAGQPSDSSDAEWDWEVYDITAPEDIGDLMGAIHGIHHQGFIGETYQRFPFPQDPAGFKQKTDGKDNRAAFEEMVVKYGRSSTAKILAARESKTISIGEYRFSASAFVELLKYVWVGGYPRWQDEKPPDYVTQMMAAVRASDHWLLAGVF